MMNCRDCKHFDLWTSAVVGGKEHKHTYGCKTEGDGSTANRGKCLAKESTSFWPDANMIWDNEAACEKFVPVVKRQMDISDLLRGDK